MLGGGAKELAITVMIMKGKVRCSIIDVSGLIATHMERPIYLLSRRAQSAAGHMGVLVQLSDIKTQLKWFSCEQWESGAGLLVGGDCSPVTTPYNDSTIKS